MVQRRPRRGLRGCRGRVRRREMGILGAFGRRSRVRRMLVHRRFRPFPSVVLLPKILIL